MDDKKGREVVVAAQRMGWKAVMAAQRTWEGAQVFFKQRPTPIQLPKKALFFP